MIVLDGHELTIDVTFPGDQPWDGHQPLVLACDPRVREPLIAALAHASGDGGKQL